mmetsp:Transcript_4708/g.11431  ORF Transcript_4708/g.11431 Transcript_4708/m.11431 type:complete len:275 (+) Transcript_4708:370-1194(+)
MLFTSLSGLSGSAPPWRRSGNLVRASIHSSCIRAELTFAVRLYSTRNGLPETEAGSLFLVAEMRSTTAAAGGTGCVARISPQNQGWPLALDANTVRPSTKLMGKPSTCRTKAASPDASVAKTLVAFHGDSPVRGLDRGGPSLTQEDPSWMATVAFRDAGKPLRFPNTYIVAPSSTTKTDATALVDDAAGSRRLMSSTTKKKGIPADVFSTVAQAMRCEPPAVTTTALPVASPRVIPGKEAEARVAPSPSLTKAAPRGPEAGERPVRGAPTRSQA